MNDMESDVPEACIMSSSWFRMYAAVEHRKRMSLHTYLLGQVGTKISGIYQEKPPPLTPVRSFRQRERNEKKRLQHALILPLPLPLYLHENDTSYIVREELARGC